MASFFRGNSGRKKEHKTIPGSLRELYPEMIYSKDSSHVVPTFDELPDAISRTVLGAIAAKNLTNNVEHSVQDLGGWPTKNVCFHDFFVDGLPLRCYGVKFVYPEPGRRKNIFFEGQRPGHLTGTFTVMLGPLDENVVSSSLFYRKVRGLSSDPPIVWFSEIYEFNFSVPFSEKHTYNDHLKVLAQYIVNDSEMYIDKFDSSLLDGGLLCRLSKMDQENNWNLPP